MRTLIPEGEGSAVEIKQNTQVSNCHMFVWEFFEVEDNIWTDEMTCSTVRPTRRHVLEEDGGVVSKKSRRKFAWRIVEKQ